MARPQTLAVLAVAAVVVAVAFFMAQSAAPPLSLVDLRAGASSEEEAAPASLPSTGDVAAGGAELGGDLRQQRPVDTRARAGRLLVDVVWHDLKAAANVAVLCQASKWRALAGSPQHAITDAEGRVVFEQLGTREVHLSTFCGGEAKAEAKATEDTRVRIVIPKGVDVVGLVRDSSGTPLAGADIWITSGHRDYRGGYIATQSDARGAFSLRSLEAGTSLGAILEGYLRSDLVDLDCLDTFTQPTRVEIVLAGGGGTLRVQVVDADKNPAVAARVAIGVMPKRFEYRNSTTRIETWTPRMFTTDADGRAEAHGFPAGKHDLVVAHSGSPILEGDIDVEEGLTTDCLIELQRPVTVHGIAKDNTGKVLADIVVRAVPRAFEESFLQVGQFDFDSVLGFPETATAADGSYRLDGVAPGEVHLYAMSQPSEEPRIAYHAKKSLQAAEGTSIEWNPVIAPGHCIEGLVAYRCGSPMEKVFISATKFGAKNASSILTAKDGSFRFVNLEPVAYSLRVQLNNPPAGQPRWLFQDDVYPDRGRVRIAADFDAPVKSAPAAVRGRILDKFARITHPDALEVHLYSQQRSMQSHRWSAGDRHGTFHIKDAWPGRYYVVAKSADDTIYVGPSFDVAPGQQLDLGELWTVAKGRLLLVLERQAGSQDVEPTISLTPANLGSHGVQLKPGRRSSVEHDNLSVGVHTVWLHGDHVAVRQAEVTIRGGETTELTMDLHAAATTTFEVTWQPAAKWQWLELSVIDASGTEVEHWSSSHPAQFGQPLSMPLTLPLGPLRVRAETKNGLRATSDFVARTVDGKGPVIRLELR